MARITLLLSAFALLFSLVAASIPQSHIGTTVPHVSDKTAELSHPRIVDPSQADFPFSPSNASPEPRPMLEKRRHHRKNHSYSPVTVTNGKVTYYGGGQLLNPCLPRRPEPQRRQHDRSHQLRFAFPVRRQDKRSPRTMANTPL